MLHVRLPFTAIFVGLIVELAVSVSLIVLPITLVSGAVRPGTSSYTVSLAVGVIRTLVVSRICVCVLLVLLQSSWVDCNWCILGLNSKGLDNRCGGSCCRGGKHLCAQASVVTSCHGLHHLLSPHGSHHRLLHLLTRHHRLLLLHLLLLLRWLWRRYMDGFAVIALKGNPDFSRSNQYRYSRNRLGTPWMSCKRLHGMSCISANFTVTRQRAFKTVPEDFNIFRTVIVESDTHFIIAVLGLVLHLS